MIHIQILTLVKVPSEAKPVICIYSEIKREIIVVYVNVYIVFVAVDIVGNSDTQKTE